MTSSSGGNVVIGFRGKLDDLGLKTGGSGGRGSSSSASISIL